MRSLALILIVFPAGIDLAAPATAQDQDEAPPPNFADHVEPILRERCLACHRGSRARNGLQLKSVRSILKGGSSGAAIVPGDADASKLFRVAAHIEEPFMPPEDERLGDEALAVLRAWIDGGARATANDKGASAEGASGPTFVPPPVALAGANGEPILPSGVATQPVWWSERADAVVALAASPTAPLVAVAGHRQISLYGVPGGALLGLLPFPEGDVRSLRFSPSGALLVAGGGRGADRGLAVGWDVASGARVFELGDEPDLALAADISVDHGCVALGGPDRIVRAYSARSGELLYEKGEHTDWITAVAFSPDGVLLATGDRAGGVFVWEALTGREYQALPAQPRAVTALDWRADSLVLAVGSEDGKVSLFEMENGRRVKRLGAHRALLDVRYLRDGRLVTAGREGRVTLWKASLRRERNFDGARGIATTACVTHDGAYVVVGDFEGDVRVLPAGGGEPVARLRPNPETDEEREVAAARAALPALDEAVRVAQEALAPARAELASAAAEAGDASAAVTAAASRVEPAVALEATTRAAAEEAEVLLALYETPLATKLDAEAAARATVEELAAAAARDREHLDAALLRAVDAEERLQRAKHGERERAEEAERLAQELLGGATATAQLSAARAAQARIEHERCARELDLWTERTRPHVAHAGDVRSRATEAADSADRARTDAAAIEAAAAAGRSRRDSAAASLSEAESALASASAARDAGAKRVRSSQEAWTSLRAELVASGGRVPRE